MAEQNVAFIGLFHEIEVITMTVITSVFKVNKVEFVSYDMKYNHRLCLKPSHLKQSVDTVDSNQWNRISVFQPPKPAT